MADYHDDIIIQRGASAFCEMSPRGFCESLWKV